MLKRFISRSRFAVNASSDESEAIVVIAHNDRGVVLLASPDGERFRTVDRLAMTASEADALFEESAAPTVSGNDLRHLYGDGIARLRLRRA